MTIKREHLKRILVCVPTELLKKIETLKGKYRNRSQMIREALELLIVSHRKKSIEKELKEGLKLIKNLRGDFAERSMYFGKESSKN